MENLKKFIDEILNIDLKDITISGVRGDCEATKIKIRPVSLKGEIVFQATSYVETKVLHTNYEAGQLAPKLMDWMANCYKQMQVHTRTLEATVLVSKKGKVTIKQRKVTGDNPFAMIAAHNREKNYILKEGLPVDFLVDLGVMTPEGKVVKARYDKFRQINRFLEFIQDILPALEARKKDKSNKRLHIIDFGCGKSYLTFAMYYYLKVLKGYDIAVTGLDLKKDVIANCNHLAKKYGYEHLEFLHGDIASYEGTDSVDMVVTLHACDTATDYALYKAVLWNAKVILSVPCCQHELNRQIQSDACQALFQYGLIKERMAALITDGLRGELLDCAGYKTQILEFIDMEHTPKNILIRAVLEADQACNNFRLSDKYLVAKENFHIESTLERLLVGMERIC